MQDDSDGQTARADATGRSAAKRAEVARARFHVAVDGEVIEADPPRKLVHTFRMAMDPETAAEGFTRVTYDIAEIQGLCKVTITHDVTDAPRMADIVSGGELERVGVGGHRRSARMRAMTGSSASMVATSGSSVSA